MSRQHKSVVVCADELCDRNNNVHNKPTHILANNVRKPNKHLKLAVRTLYNWFNSMVKFQNSL